MFVTIVFPSGLCAKTENAVNADVSDNRNVIKVVVADFYNLPAPAIRVVVDFGVAYIRESVYKETGSHQKDIQCP